MEGGREGERDREMEVGGGYFTSLRLSFPSWHCYNTQEVLKE